MRLTRYKERQMFLCGNKTTCYNTSDILHYLINIMIQDGSVTIIPVIQGIKDKHHSIYVD